MKLNLPLHGKQLNHSYKACRELFEIMIMQYAFVEHVDWVDNRVHTTFILSSSSFFFSFFLVSILKLASIILGLKQGKMILPFNFN